MPLDPSTLTAPSLRALLRGIIDYAGLFPPAGLPLSEALPRFARYRRDADAWMLARFVLPVGRLDALAPYAALFEDAPPFRFAVLGTGGKDPDAFLSGLEADLALREAFHERHPGRVAADVMEVRFPPEHLGASPAALDGFFSEAAARLDGRGMDVFYEIPLDDETVPRLPGLLGALAEHDRALRNAGGERAGLKLRTGGLEPEAFPEPSHLAAAIDGARRTGVRFKATAGLHHPVRAYHESVGAKMFGFLNVFGGAALAAAHDLDADALRPLLVEEDAAAFGFTPDGFHWRDLSAPVAALREARADFAVSFGSCSFDEPREDLRALGML